MTPIEIAEYDDYYQRPDTTMWQHLEPSRIL
jgi:hypothetical protein